MAFSVRHPGSGFLFPKNFLELARYCPPDGFYNSVPLAARLTWTFQVCSASTNRTIWELKITNTFWFHDFFMPISSFFLTFFIDIYGSFMILGHIFGENSRPPTRCWMGTQQLGSEAKWRFRGMFRWEVVDSSLDCWSCWLDPLDPFRIGIRFLKGFLFDPNKDLRWFEPKNFPYPLGKMFWCQDCFGKLGSKKPERRL